ncbi:unnamed protein product, partial [Haemonchus placei]|uniref:SRP40_C domain-containing protein n=1 Tax=Haemonchus placei TaxID=6290 RepID=A0A0N4WW96_HAEPC
WPLYFASIVKVFSTDYEKSPSARFKIKPLFQVFLYLMMLEFPDATVLRFLPIFLQFSSCKKPYFPSNDVLNVKRKSNEPFRRVTITKDSLPEKFKDNSYDRSHDQWGAKAHEALSKVQGKGFRHEKTKKKKGSYGGGPISTSVNSIKFSDSD